MRTPFVWSHTRWFAIDADPPFPQENTVAPRSVGVRQDGRRAFEFSEVAVFQA